jgi:GDPmannose 4,6-dehydratase
MWRILQHDKPDDFVLATGEMHSVREFLDVAFSSVDLDWKDYETHDERFDRPSEVDQLLGDSTKARTELGWEPKYQFEDGIKETVKWYLNNDEWLDNIINGDYLKYYNDMYNLK